MKILLITDIHYGKNTQQPDEQGVLRVRSYGSQFEQALPMLVPLLEDHDLVMNLGDLIEDESLEKDTARYNEAHQFLADAGTPVKHVLGNHDVKNMSRFSLAEINNEGDTFYSFEMGGLLHIVLDPVRETFPEDEDQELQPILPEEQVLWLEKTLDQADKPSLIYIHYGLDEECVTTSDYFMKKPKKALVRNREEVRTIMERSKKVLAVFNGHTHFYHHSIIHGIEYINVPGFSEDDGQKRPAYKLVSLTVNGEDLFHEILTLHEAL